MTQNCTQKPCEIVAFLCAGIKGIPYWIFQLLFFSVEGCCSISHGCALFLSTTKQLSVVWGAPWILVNIFIKCHALSWRHRAIVFFFSAIKIPLSRSLLFICLEGYHSETVCQKPNVKFLMFSFQNFAFPFTMTWKKSTALGQSCKKGNKYFPSACEEAVSSLHKLLSLSPI